MTIMLHIIIIIVTIIIIIINNNNNKCNEHEHWIKQLSICFSIDLSI